MASIPIDQDPWIIRQGNNTPMYVPEGLKGRRVKDLLLENGDWDSNRIRQNFLFSDVEDILAIPLGKNGEKDRIIWNLDSKGMFNVKSAYYLALKLQKANDSSGSSDKGNGSWERIWK